MSTIFRKELRYYFSTPIAYIVLGLYWVGLALFLWVIPGVWNIPQSGYAQLEGLFTIAPWLFLLLCPALTMRLIAEEKQSGTWQLLLVRPLPLWRIVTQKYAAAFTLCLIAQIPALLHFLLVWQLAEPAGNIDSGAFFGSLIGLVAMIAVFIAIGLLASSITKSQIVSFILSLIICFMLFYGFDLIAMLTPNGHTADHISNLGLHAHYQSLARGLLDLRDLMYFLIVTILSLLLTTIGLYRTTRA